jgi:hypothetical protein
MYPATTTSAPLSPRTPTNFTAQAAGALDGGASATIGVIDRAGADHLHGNVYRAVGAPTPGPPEGDEPTEHASSVWTMPYYPIWSLTYLAIGVGPI